LCGMKFPTDENVIVGLNRADDAGVYRVSEDLALIQTVDFFTPVVDDPYAFGQIAAANALSDVYAMGGTPKTAMNLVAFPAKAMGLEILRSILEGGIDKIKEADVVLIGGHSIEDKELKYGLSVTGFIHPNAVLTKKNLKAGDCLVLTKPIGTGIINTAIKAAMAPEDLIQEVTRIMATLNRGAAETMKGFDVHACTDITGFGLLGHLTEMMDGSGMHVKLFSDRVPVIRDTLFFAAMGLIPGGAHKNRDFFKKRVEFSGSVELVLQDVLFDPQTSGGLLISLDAVKGPALIDELRNANITSATIIGEVASDGREILSVL